MNSNLKLVITGLVFSGFLFACGEKTKQPGETSGEETHEDGHEAESGHGEGVVFLTRMQREAIGLELGPLQEKNLSGHVKVTGTLEVPPQSKASISAVLGGNVHKIFVIEGEKIKKGQPLALLENPAFVQMQVDLQAKTSQLDFLEKKYQRKQNLYAQDVASGKSVQQAKADYLSAKAQVEGLKAKMDIFHLDPKKIINGKIYRYLPVVSPISGFVKAVNVTLGQYVRPQEMIFGVVNTSDIHADLMVFEKDISQVKEGQKVELSIPHLPKKSYLAEIFSVGKIFEEDPKAVHVHAEIEGSTEGLIPGTYLEGRILVDDRSVWALPESAVVREGNERFIFVKTETLENENGEPWKFKKVSVKTGIKDQGWVEVNLFQPLGENVQIAYNAAYKLISEMNKSETGHHH